MGSHEKMENEREVWPPILSTTVAQPGRTRHPMSLFVGFVWDLTLPRSPHVPSTHPLKASKFQALSGLRSYK